jgi:hypothetical protein
LLETINHTTTFGNMKTCKSLLIGLPTTIDGGWLTADEKDVRANLLGKHLAANAMPSVSEFGPCREMRLDHGKSRIPFLKRSIRYQLARRFYPAYFWYRPTCGFAAWYNPQAGTNGGGAAVYGPYGGTEGWTVYNPRTGTYARGGVTYGPL